MQHGVKRLVLADIEPMESASRVIVERVYRAADELRQNRDTYRPLTAGFRKSIREASDKEPMHGNNVTVRLIEVGQYNAGCAFGLGEQMEDRMISAKTDVECLLIPRYWLFQSEQNLGNIWQK